MTLIPLEHAHRLASPEQAEAFYRGLRARRVGLRGCHTADPERIELLVAAADPRRAHTISFQGGALDGAARSALAELCGCEFDFFQVRTASAGLRVWPGRQTWVERLSERLATDLLETQSIAEALDAFSGICGTRIDLGHISRVCARARSPLLGFLRAARTEVHVVLDVTLQTARSLSEQFPGHKVEWLHEVAQVDFPDGRIRGFLKTPKVDERHRRRWQARVDKALRRAELV